MKCPRLVADRMAETMSLNAAWPSIYGITSFGIRKVLLPIASGNQADALLSTGSNGWTTVFRACGFIFTGPGTTGGSRVVLRAIALRQFRNCRVSELAGGGHLVLILEAHERELRVFVEHALLSISGPRGEVH